MLGLICQVAFFIWSAGQRMPMSSVCKLRHIRSPFFSVVQSWYRYTWLMSLSVGLFKYTSDVSNFEENPLQEKRFSNLLDQSDLLWWFDCKKLETFRIWTEVHSDWIEHVGIYLKSVCSLPVQSGVVLQKSSL